jgi:hypothetical protein
MNKNRPGIAIKTYSGTALAKRQGKTINIRQSLATRIQALAVVYIHGVKDPLLDLCQVHNGKSLRGVAGELKPISELVEMMTPSQCSAKSCCAREHLASCFAGSEAVRLEDSTASSISLRRSSIVYSIQRGLGSLHYDVHFEFIAV